MLQEGVAPAMIENAARMAGMPVGPLALNDEIALDLAWKILQATKADLGDAYRARAIDAIIEEMVVRRERFGRKNRRGFYDYPESGRKRLWDGIAEFAPPRPAEQFDPEILKQRLLSIQALETARCFEEGVLDRSAGRRCRRHIGLRLCPLDGWTAVLYRHGRRRCVRPALHPFRAAVRRAIPPRPAAAADGGVRARLL